MIDRIYNVSRCYVSHLCELYPVESIQHHPFSSTTLTVFGVRLLSAESAASAMYAMLERGVIGGATSSICFCMPPSYILSIVVIDTAFDRELIPRTAVLTMLASLLGDQDEPGVTGGGAGI